MHAISGGRWQRVRPVARPIRNSRSAARVADHRRVGDLRDRLDQLCRPFLGSSVQADLLALVASRRGLAHGLNGCDGDALVILRQQRRTIRAGLDCILGTSRSGDGNHGARDQDLTNCHSRIPACRKWQPGSRSQRAGRTTFNSCIRRVRGGGRAGHGRQDLRPASAIAESRPESGPVVERTERGNRNQGATAMQAEGCSNFDFSANHRVHPFGPEMSPSDAHLPSPNSTWLGVGVSLPIRH